jgi:hypothetical protein
MEARKRRRGSKIVLLTSSAFSITCKNPYKCRNWSVFKPMKACVASFSKLENSNIESVNISETREEQLTLRVNTQSVLISGDDISSMSITHRPHYTPSWLFEILNQLKLLVLLLRPQAH